MIRLESDPMRKYWKTALKIAVTVLGVGYIIATTDLEQLARELPRIDLAWAGVAVVLIALSLVVRAYRWSVLLRGLGSRISLWRLIELYFVGNFFNTFLPSGFGGDAVRILEAAEDISADAAAGTVIVDRLTGLMALFALALVGLPFRPAGFPSALLWLVSLSAAAGLAGGFVLLEGSLIRRFGSWLPGPLSPIGDGPVARVLRAVQGCGWPAVWRALGISLIFNGILIAWWMVIGIARGHDIPLSYYVLIVPVMSVLLLVPAVGGVGPRESAAPLLFSAAGLNAVEAALLPFSVKIATSVVGVLGAPVYILSLLRQRRARAQTRAESADHP